MKDRGLFAHRMNSARIYTDFSGSPGLSRVIVQSFLLPYERIDYIFFCFPQSTAESRVSVLKDRIQWALGIERDERRVLIYSRAQAYPFSSWLI